ncbi:hypothetical protein [Paraburkholderia tagetis]|uniref:Uncharacterized protein n=1 Tax=Paraburkholderia tagetis TaxID=2913261 RepID=A0A9X1UM84_9BURK|nr:hypothetical protein [Paraburkholderia tagetis]MCG5077968.1 hypothetical protein [Paraburkholderia tagetis]
MPHADDEQVDDMFLGERKQSRLADHQFVKWTVSSSPAPLYTFTFKGASASAGWSTLGKLTGGGVTRLAGQWLSSHSFPVGHHDVSA